MERKDVDNEAANRIGTLEEQLARCYGAPCEDATMAAILDAVRALAVTMKAMRAEIMELRSLLGPRAVPATAKQRGALVKLGLPCNVSQEQAAFLIKDAQRKDRVV